MAANNLIEVLIVDKDTCVNCHACISACPVKFCNDGSGDYIIVNSNMCLACGSCITACTHNARTFVDDFKQLLIDLQNGEKIIAIAAPSVAANFPDQYLNLNGWLISLGIKGVFDVSFGAELTVKSYLDFIEKNNPQTVISQPCPAIVTYIQIYQPELLKYLAPADSPMLHTMKMIREYYKEYSDYKIAIISPCNAKKREYIETGLGDYNIAYKSISEYCKENNIDFANFEKVDYLNPPAERAVLFSSPGGLMETIERWIPEIRKNTRKIEGPNLIYDYLKKLPTLISEKKSQLLIDCLNCDNGCNAGPLTLNKEKPIDEIEYWINKRNDELKEEFLKKYNQDSNLVHKEIVKILDLYWKENLYNRKYLNLSENYTVKIPSSQELSEIYIKMHKYSDKDIYNCTSCGYGSCEQMAIAIHNGLNRPENCHFYLTKETELSHEQVEKSQKRLSTILATTIEGFFQINKEGYIIDANQALRDLVEDNNIIGKHIHFYLDSENIEVLEKNRKLREADINSSYELVITAKSGKKKWCSISGTVIKDENGDKIGSFAMVTDISELKNAQIELQNLNTELEERVEQRTIELYETLEELKATNDKISQYNVELQKLSIVADNTSNSVIILDKNGDLEWANHSFTTMYGYKLEEFIFEFGNNILKTSSKSEISDYFYKSLNEKKSVTYETKNLTKQKKVLWTQTNLTPVIEDDEVIKFVLMDTDITEIKLAHQEIVNQQEEILNQREELLAQRDEIMETATKLQSSFEELQDSEQKLYDIINFLPEPVLIVDKNNSVIFWNKSIEALTGVKSEEIIGKSNFEYSIPFFGERKPMLVDLLYFSDEELKNNYPNITKEKGVLYGEAYTTNLIAKNLYLKTSASFLYNHDKEVVGAIEVFHDITTIKEAEAKLQIFNKEILKQKDELVKKSIELDEIIEELKVTAEVVEAANFELETKNSEINEKNLALEKNHKLILENNIKLQKQKEDILSFNELLKSQQIDILRANKVLERQKTEIEQQRNELESQRDLATNQRDMIAHQNKEITDSIEYAKRIQQALLTIENNILPKGYFVFFKPKNIVSGDFFWIRKFFNYTIVAVADCTGHGVPGAFMSMLGISLLNEISSKNFRKINKTKIQASTFLNELRTNIIRTLHQDKYESTSKDGMDIALCIIDTDTNIIQFSAAYNPLIIFRNNEMLEFKGDKMPIGIHLGEMKEFTNYEIQGIENDNLYMFSDGYIDQFGGKDQRKFLKNRFKNVLAEIQEFPIEEQHYLIDQIMVFWRQDQKQTDDMLVLGLKL